MRNQLLRMVDALADKAEEGRSKVAITSTRD